MLRAASSSGGNPCRQQQVRHLRDSLQGAQASRCHCGGKAKRVERRLCAGRNDQAHLWHEMQMHIPLSVQGRLTT